jgi:hypothetical protein
MDSTNRRPLFAGFRWVGRLGSLLALVATIGLGACNTGPASEEGDENTNSDGIGTSPSGPGGPPPPPPDPDSPSHSKMAPGVVRLAHAQDPSGCAVGTFVVAGALEGSFSAPATVCLTAADLGLD